MSKILVAYFSASGETARLEMCIRDRPVNGFVKANDFTGKTVIPFCTSASSALGQSGETLAQLAGTGNWQEGQRFGSSATRSDVADWLTGLGFTVR